MRIIDADGGSGDWFNGLLEQAMRASVEHGADFVADGLVPAAESFKGLLPQGMSGSQGSGSLAWLRVFDEDDLNEFRKELADRLIDCLTDGDCHGLEETIRAWRITAAQLEDPACRRQLMESHDVDEFVPAPSPEELRSMGNGVPEE